MGVLKQQLMMKVVLIIALFILVAESVCEGSKSKIPSRIELRDDLEDDILGKYMLCGTRKCKPCCNRAGLDRDKDKGDLKQCPHGYIHDHFHRYNMIWPIPDKYLRVCKID